MNDEAMFMLLRNKSMSYDSKVMLATNYMKAKYFGGQRVLETDDLHRLTRLVDKFLNRLEKE